ncbi:MAG TPA: ATP-binding protein, partial [Polyangiales bacterium]|nr:ATP-binding protein [Polyangiales bacterium]
SPVLVGRAHASQLVRVFLARAAESRGGVLAITGPLGVGRTRVLEACMTQAQLAGIITLHAQGSDAQEAYGLLRALATSAADRLPDAEQGLAARHLSELFAALPTRRSVRAAALPSAEPVAPEPFESASLRSERQSATRACFAALCQRGPLLIAIDDLDRADEPSVACLAALVQEPSAGPLLLAIAVASDRPARARVAIDWLCSLGTRCELAALSQPQVLELLSSVFGAVPNVAVLADRIHALSGGMPQWAMQLAEQLVDRGIVHYEAGTFVVPERLQLDELPNTLKDVSKARLASVSAEARELASAFMIDADAWFRSSELATVLGSSVGCVEAWLDELVTAGIVVREGTRTGLDRRVWLGTSLALDEPHAQDWHARLAQLFAARGDRERQAQHAWAAGDRRAAVLTLVEHCEALYRGLPGDPSLLDRVIAGMPAGFIDLLCAAIETCDEFGLSKRAELMLRIACLRIATPINDPRALAQARSLLARLRVDAGLEAWERLAHVTDAKERLTRALAETQARYDQAPEAERCCPVSEAIRVLSAVRGHAVGICSQARDFELFALLPSLAPLVPLSPTLGMTQDLTETVRHLMAGRYQRAEAGYLKIIEDLDGPIGASIDPTGHRFNRFGSYYPLGTLAADRGQEAALRWADKLESELLFQVPAWRIRMMFHRARGDSEEAERCRRQAELLRIAQRPHEMYGAGVVASELFYCIAIEDLIGIRRIVDELEAMVARFPAWQPVLEHARGEYCRLRGNPARALEHFETALAASVCGTDSLWQGAAAACLSALFALERYDEGRTRGRAWLEAAAAADLGEGANTIVARLSVIEAALGDAGAATSLADSILHWNEAQQITGLRAGLAHETRARVAMLLGDQASFEQHLAHCARYFRSGKNPPLCARYERIVRDARALGIRTSQPPPEANGSAPGAGVPVALRMRVRACADAPQRAGVLLEALARECSASSGALYVAQDSVMELRAIYGAHEPRSELDAAIQRFCKRAPAQGHASARAQPFAADDQTMDAPLALAEAERDLHQAFLLTQQTEREVLLLGVALLRGDREQRLQPSSETLSL